MPKSSTPARASRGWNAWTSQRSERRQLLVWISSYAVAQLAMIIAGALDADGLQAAVGIGGLAFCAYTWNAPSQFRRMLGARPRQGRAFQRH